jgi:hypothetical protein
VRRAILRDCFSAMDWYSFRTCKNRCRPAHHSTGIPPFTTTHHEQIEGRGVPEDFQTEENGVNEEEYLKGTVTVVAAVVAGMAVTTRLVLKKTP